ncbi:MAG TPA: CDP-alcohol phosphatidyltransferase family protein [Chitinophagaceae bacterium]
MKQIPNIFTLLNLVFGCIAIIYILQPGLLLLPLDESGNILVPPAQLEYTSERMMMAPIFIGLAALVDFLDGFVARAFNATSALGKQLDSLADVVSFGVAPGMIVYQFLRMSYAQQEGALDTSIVYLLPALLIPAAAAYRLGKFNIDTEQSYSFKGVPTPAAGLLIASFPLIYWYTDNVTVTGILLNKWFWYAFITFICYLMVSNLPMMAIKFSGGKFKALIPLVILAVVAIAAAFFIHWLAVPLVFIGYVILSLLFQKRQAVANL